jgi:hypothetical protein
MKPVFETVTATKQNGIIAIDSCQQLSNTKSRI